MMGCVFRLQPRGRPVGSTFGIHWESNAVCGHNLAIEAMRLEIEGLLIVEMVFTEVVPSLVVDEMEN